MSLYILKWQSESVNGRRTNNTIDKRKRTKRQTTIHKTPNRNPYTEQHDPPKPGVNSGAPEGLVFYIALLLQNTIKSLIN